MTSEDSSAVASAQSNQSSLYALSLRGLAIFLVTSEESGGCPGCSKSSLDAKPISNGITAYDGFSGQYFRIFEYNFCSFVVANLTK